ncbi:MAG: mercury(II) reductase [Cytophagaceae bacterium]|nr:mercury(II) reductase [Cytophagaceae bacterium]
METNQFDLIIIGGGSAAFAAASTANDLQLNTLLINGGLPIGGTCVNVGCVPSKNLIRAAESIYKASHSPFKGISLNQPKWSYAEIIKEKKGLVKELQKKKYLDVIDQLQFVTTIEGHAEFTGNNKITVNGKEYEAIKIIIATGASTFIPPINGLNEVPYFTNETLFDLEELPESLIILGGGYIGLEIAQTYQRFGTRVHIVESLDKILNRESKDITDVLEEQFKEEGIIVDTGIKIERIFKEGKKIKVEGFRNSLKMIFESTHLLVATGRKPNTQNLGLEQAGVELVKSGHIRVNEFLETNIQGVYAIGDCINTPAFVYTAAYEGSLAVKNAFQGTQIKTDFIGLPYVIFTDPQIAGVGMDENESEAAGISYEVKVLPLSEAPRSQAALDTRGFIKLIRNKENDLLLGARVIAPEGGELISELGLAVKFKIPVKELANHFHPYLTLSEGIKLAAITFEKDISKLSCCAH